MAQASARLVGRDAELDALERALADLRAGAPGVLELRGEPGIGKSTLLGELGERAAAGGVVVLAGRAAEFERELPFGVIVDALDDYLAALEPEALAPLGEERLEDLASLFPSLARTQGSNLPERYRLHRAVRALLERLGALRPLLLSLDDLHWADPASIDLVAHLLDRGVRGPVLLAVALRPARVPPRLSVALEQAGRGRRLERLALGPLDADAAEVLMGGALDRPARAEVFRESGGNPFYLEELARGRARRPEGPAARAAARAAGGVPEPVAAVLAEEMTGLTDAARALLEGAAVAGDPFEPGVAAEIARLSDEEGLEALDELLAAELVRTTDLPRRFRFRHPLVRRAVYGSSGAGWRLGAHGRAARALADRGAPLAARAHHVERSATQGDGDAIALLASAARIASPRAPESAAEWYSSALRLMGEGEDPGRRLELLVPLAGALASSGRLAESRDALQEALSRVPDDDAARRGRLVADLASVEHWLGRHTDARELLAGALARLQDQEGPEAVALQVELAHDHVYSAEFDGVRRWAERALAGGRILGDRPLQAAAAARLALALHAMGQVAETDVALADAAALVDELTDEELARRLDACVWLGWAELMADRFAAAGARFERGLTVARATGRLSITVPLLAGLAAARVGEGRLAEAVDLADAAVETAALARNDHLLVWALLSRNRTAIAQGDIREALASAERAGAASGRETRNLISVTAVISFAEAHLEAGDPRSCLDALLAVGAPDLPQLMPNTKARCAELMTRAELALGRPEAAAGWADLAEVAAAGRDGGTALAFAGRARAAALLAADDPAGALVAARVSVDAASAAGAPIEAARSRILVGSALAAAGDRDGAVAELEGALAVLNDCGALLYRDQTARELRRLGAHVARRGAGGRGVQGVPALSAREREVAELVAKGCTNRQIAARLHLSEKTVEKNLTRIFAKLEVGSRAAVAAAVSREPRESWPANAGP